VLISQNQQVIPVTRCVKKWTRKKEVRYKIVEFRVMTRYFDEKTTEYRSQSLLKKYLTRRVNGGRWGRGARRRLKVIFLDFNLWYQCLSLLESGGFLGLLTETGRSTFTLWYQCLNLTDTGGFLLRLPVLLCSSFMRRISLLTARFTLLKKDGFI